jgi:3-isopropylmalate/(R)-2-methylmalate dehydratase small subunit
MADPLIRGRVWVLTDAAGRLIEDIDTDQIFHNAHLHLTDIAEMGRYALGNLEGWKEFPRNVRPGDLVAAGRNFGAGSSRQQAVDCFAALEVGAILAPSFSAIYFRNAVNSGFPVVRVPRLAALVAAGGLRSGEEVEIDFVSGEGRVSPRGLAFTAEPMSAVQFEIYQAGDLFRYGKKPASASGER